MVVSQDAEQASVAPSTDFMEVLGSLNENAHSSLDAALFTNADDVKKTFDDHRAAVTVGHVPEDHPLYDEAQQKLIAGLDSDDLESQRSLFKLYDALVEDIHYYTELSDSALAISNMGDADIISRDAARQYFKAYAVGPTELTLDYHINRGLSLLATRREITNPDFTRKFMEDSSELLPLVLLRDVPVGETNAAEVLYIASAKQPRVYSVVSGTKVAENLAKTHLGKRDYIIVEFIDHLKNQEFNLARAYGALCGLTKTHDIELVRGRIRRGDVVDGDLEGLDLNPSNVVGEVDRIIGLKSALSPLGSAKLSQDYLRVSRYVPTVGTSEAARKFVSNTEGIHDDGRRLMLELASRRTEPEVVEAILNSEVLAERLTSINGSTYSLNQFMNIIRPNVAGITAGNLSGLVNEAWRDPVLQETIALESSLDWSDYPGDTDRRVVVERLKVAGDDYKPALLSLGDGRKPNAKAILTEGAGLIRQIGEYPELVALTPSLMFEVDSGDVVLLKPKGGG